MIAIGSDHGGYDLKCGIIKYLESKGIEVLDCGTYNTDSVDYPDIAVDVCSKITDGTAQMGILVCGTGIGISIAANKVKGIRAALVCSPFMAQMAREHNNANIICFGGRTTTYDEATEMLDAFLKAEFQGGRHQTRVDKIMNIEN